ncbi:MAG TPA: pirin-like C-terminal cupin domain-containing protein, partial [Dongiaceae bacterium]|nr:pirin-like C-terminal cupin domain-containing protein [Dongiaceae bacterium]
DPHIWDIELNGNTPLTLPLEGHLHANLFVYNGNATVNGETLAPYALTQIKPGTKLTVVADGSAKLLLLAGKPLREPVVQYGPFVMNNRDQIETAIRDYQAGTLTEEKSH